MKILGALSIAIFLSACTSGVKQITASVTASPTPVSSATPDPTTDNASVCQQTSKDYYFPLSACQVVSTKCTTVVVTNNNVNYVCYKVGTTKSVGPTVNGNFNLNTVNNNVAVFNNSGSTPPPPGPFNPWKFGVDNNSGSWVSSGVACSGYTDCNYTGQAGVTLTGDNHCLLAQLPTSKNPNISGTMNVNGVREHWFYYYGTCDSTHYNAYSPAGTYGDFTNPNDSRQCIWGIASGPTCKDAFVHNMGNGNIGFYCQPQAAHGTQNYSCLPGTSAVYLAASGGYKCKLNPSLAAPANLVASNSVVSGHNAFIYAPSRTAPQCQGSDVYTTNGGGWCIYSYIPAGWHGFTSAGIGYVDPHGVGCR